MSILYVTGIGPGFDAFLTNEARTAIEQSDVICGYTIYVDLLRSRYPDREFITTPMRQEIERCRLAMEAASSGRTVAMVCSGDAGIYGMAGPILEMSSRYPDVDIRIVPGITAAVSGAAVLGAPLMNDFCVISLSDLLTPWPVIEKRLRVAAMGDFCVCIYNAMSKKRPHHLAKACAILMELKPADTVCGWVRNIGREGQESAILTLGELADAQLDMFTTVFVGCSETRVLNGRMVTDRGYQTL